MMTRQQCSLSDLPSMWRTALLPLLALEAFVVFELFSIAGSQLNLLVPYIWGHIGPLSLASWDRCIRVIYAQHAAPPSSPLIQTRPVCRIR